MVGHNHPNSVYVQNHSMTSNSTIDAKSPALRLDRSGNRGHAGSGANTLPKLAAPNHPRARSDSVHSDILSNDSFGLGLPNNFQHSTEVQDRRLRALEDHLQNIQMTLAKASAKEKKGTPHSNEVQNKRQGKSGGEKKKKTLSFLSVPQLIRYSFIGLLIALTIYVSWFLTKQWIDVGSQPSVTYSLESADTLAMPTAGMIPAPYATDARCFQPQPLSCTAYTGEVASMDCMSWLSVVSTELRPGGAPKVIWALDGVKATQDGYYFQSILDYVEYSFVFPDDCTEPYLWVYVSGDTRIVTEAKLDPNISMRAYAQTSFLIQGGQYVMVAFSMLQDVDLNSVVTNTTSISVSSMMWSAFNASRSKTATAVFRPGSFRIQTTTQQPGMTFLEFLSNLGGWIGLFLGFSVLHIVEFGEFLYEHFCEKKEDEDGGSSSDDDDGVHVLSPDDKK